jgi:hypothetical protein
MLEILLSTALKSKPQRFSSMEQALEFAMSNLTIPINKWLPKSKILQDIRYQRRISEYA